MASKRGKKPDSSKAGSAKKVLDFLARLAEDNDLQVRFKTEARGTMKEAGISTTHQEALLSGDLERIKGLLPGGKIHLPPNTVIKVTLIVIKF